jgi:hypothetical protein
LSSPEEKNLLKGLVGVQVDQAEEVPAGDSLNTVLDMGVSLFAGAALR